MSCFKKNPPYSLGVNVVMSSLIEFYWYCSTVVVVRLLKRMPEHVRIKYLKNNIIQSLFAGIREDYLDGDEDDRIEHANNPDEWVQSDFKDLLLNMKLSHVKVKKYIMHNTCPIPRIYEGTSGEIFKL